jgi:hypothetical protein
MTAGRTSPAIRPLSLAGAAFIALGVLSWTGTALQAQGQSSAAPIALSFHSRAEALAPGDSREAIVDLHADANSPIHDVRVTVRVRDVSLLTSDRVRGLQVDIAECPDAWSNVVREQRAVYSCDQPSITLLRARPILIEGAKMPDRAQAGTRHLRIRIRLPAKADNRFQGLHAAMTYTFSGQP